MRDRAWTLILWDIENVPIPDQLRTPAGIKNLRELLKDKFGKARQHQLHCMKLACHWPDYRSPYAELLGLLTTLGDVEALGYQWQGQKDKTHNADRLLKQAADRFMHMLEDHNGPDHCVVFITSDQDFGEKILELQRRNFKVVVLYHKPHASQRPANIINAADEAHDWLPFLRREMSRQDLSISAYDATVCHASQPAAIASANVSARSQGKQKPSPERKDHTTPVSVEQAESLLTAAVHKSHPASDDELLRAIVEACLANGLQIQSPSQLLLSPVSCCHIGAIVRQRNVEMTGKLIANLESDELSSFFQLVAGPKGTQPAVIPKLEELISKKQKKSPVKDVLSMVQTSFIHPQRATSGNSIATKSKQSQPKPAENAKQQPQEVGEVAAVLMSSILTLECEDQVFIHSVALACILCGLESGASGLQLRPVLLSRVGDQCKGLDYTGKLSDKLRSPACQPYCQLVHGPGEAAVMLKASILFRGTSAPLHKVVKVIDEHPKA